MKAIVCTLMLGLAAVPACRGSASEAEVEQAEAVDADDIAEILVSTPWLDRAPRDYREKFSGFVFDEEFGAFVDGSAVRGSFDVFGYRMDSDDKEMTFVFLQDEKRARTSFKIERVRGKEPFDLRLTLKSSPRGPKVYYGFSQDHGEAIGTATFLIHHARDGIAAQKAAAK